MKTLLIISSIFPLLSSTAHECISPSNAMRMMRVTTGNTFDTISPLEGHEFLRFRHYLSEVFRAPIPSNAAQVYNSNEPEHKKTAHVILFDHLCAVGEFDLPKQIWEEFAKNPEVGAGSKGDI